MARRDDEQVRDGVEGPVEVPHEPMLLLGGPARPGGATHDHPVRPPRVSPAVEAVLAGILALVVLPKVGMVQVLLAQRSLPTFIFAVALSAVAAGVVAGMAHRWLGGGSRLNAMAVGSVAGLLAGTAFGGIVTDLGRVLNLVVAVPQLRVAALVVVVLAARHSGGPAKVLGGAAGMLTGMAVAGALSTGAVLLP